MTTTIQTSDARNEVINSENGNEMSKWFKVYKGVKAMIDGEVKEIIPVILKDYSMDRPTDKKKLIEKLDKESMLDCIFHLTDAKIAFDENLTVTDLNGKEISKETFCNIKDFTYLVCDTADSYWRFTSDKVLNNTQIHEFASIQDYFKAIGSTNLYSRGLNTIEKIGVAAMVSGDEAYKEVHKFAKANNIPVSTAQHYFDVKFSTSTTLKMTIGLEVKTPTLQRTVEEAQIAYETVKLVMGEKAASSRYAIEAINTLTHINHSFDSVINAVKDIKASDLGVMEIGQCKEKTACLSCVITKYIKEEIKGAA